MFYIFLLILQSLRLGFAFDCITCNERSVLGSAKCKETKTTCPRGVSSCSMALFQEDSRTRIRKFCTQPTTPLYQHYTGSNFCKAVETNENEYRRKRASMPAAEENETTASIVCVCSTPMCNRGHYKRVIESTMMHQFSAPSYSFRSKAELTNTVRDHPDAGLEQQMAEAGFRM